jgi:16S rRNA (adenine1518-N6/adenine1519-N6)-dimethyltransferase
MKPKKHFGQHFLTSVGYVNKILELAAVSHGDRVLEIGPGKGALTRALLERGAVVTAIETDDDMVSYIQTNYPKVNVVKGDASSIQWEDFLQGDNWKCVSNLPYNVGTKILKSLLFSRGMFSSITVMLQKEVGLRMVAKPGDRKRGSLSSFVQVHADVRKGFIVPPGAFFPPPRVDSVVISMIPRSTPLYFPVALSIFEIVNRGLFSSPRKSIRNSLRSTLQRDEIELLIKAVDFPFSRRPSELNNQQIVHLAKILEGIRQTR